LHESNLVHCSDVHDGCSRLCIGLIKKISLDLNLLLLSVHIQLDHISLLCFLIARLTDGGLLVSIDGSSYTTYMKEEVSSYRIVIGNKTCVFEKENDPTVLRLVPTFANTLTLLKLVRVEETYRINLEYLRFDLLDLIFSLH